jgi:hypothetical protein
VYIQSFPPPGGKQVVSTGGGSEPQWRPDGRELFYLAADRTVMSVQVAPGPTLQITRPTRLFQIPIPIAGELHTRRNHYAVADNGQRFLVNAAEGQDTLTVLVNWTAGL